MSDSSKSIEKITDFMSVSDLAVSGLVEVGDILEAKIAPIMMSEGTYFELVSPLPTTPPALRSAIHPTHSLYQFSPSTTTP